MYLSERSVVFRRIEAGGVLRVETAVVCSELELLDNLTAVVAPAEANVASDELA